MDAVYKILTSDEYESFQKDGSFAGTDLDRQDGFFHLSKKEQVAGVIERFFHGIRPLYIAEITDRKFLAELKMEKASNGQEFPHYYGPSLNWTLVARVETVTN